MSKDNLSSLYNGLIKKGYSASDIGDEATFRSKMADKNNRKQLYDYVSSRGDFRIGDYDSYEKRLSAMPEPEQQPQQEVIAPVENIPVENVAQEVQVTEQPAPEKVENVQLSKKERKSLQEQVGGGMAIAVPDEMDMAAKFADTPSLYDPNARIQKALSQGKLDTIINADEEKRINNEFTPKPVVEASDIYSNYSNRFSLTERGKQLSDELAEVSQQIQNKYADEFLASDEYKALQKKYKGEELNKAANEAFSRIYSDKISKELEPYTKAYQKEAFSRYENEIARELDRYQEKERQRTKQKIASDVSSLSTSVDNQLEENHRKLVAKSGSGNNAMNALMGSRQYNTATAGERKSMGELEAARSLLEESQNIIDEAARKGKTNFVAGVGRGFADTAFNPETWSFGLTDMRDAKVLTDALDKFDRGETLTQSEQTLMDAAVANMATNAYYYSDLGRGYKAGMVSGQSVPFMLEFAINPVSASGSGIAKSILKYGMKKFGKSAVQNNAAKFAARLVGDAAAAAAMTGTSSAARVAAGTIERAGGNIQLDETGTGYEGRTGQMSTAEALGKSFTSTFLENQSEMVFNAFKGIGPKIWKTAERHIPGGTAAIMDNAIMGKAGEIYRKIKSNPTLQEVAKRTQFHGLGEEYLEEVYNNFANIPLGEMTLEEATDLDNNIDTFLGLAPTSVAFGLLGLGGLAKERIQHRNKMKAAFGNMTRIERERLAKLEEIAEKGGNEDIKTFIRETILDNELTPEEKKAEIEYAYNLAVGNAIDDIEATQRQEVAENHNTATQEGEAIYSEHNPEKMRQTVLGREVAEQKLLDAGLSVEDIESMKNMPVEERQDILNNMDDVVANTATDFFTAYDRETAMNEALDTAHEEEVVQAREMLNDIVLPNQTVTVVPLGMYGNEQAQYGIVVSGIDANGNPTQSNDAVVTYPVQMINGTPDFSTIDKANPIVAIPKSYTDAMVFSADEAFNGMLTAYQQDAAILDGTPIEPGAQFPIMADDGTMQDITVANITPTGDRIVVMPDGKTVQIPMDELSSRKRNAELAPIMEESANEEEIHQQAVREAVTEGYSDAVKNLQPQAGERLVVDGRNAVIKEVAPDGLVIDFMSESGDIIGTDIVPPESYYDYKQSLLETSQNEPIQNEPTENEGTTENVQDIQPEPVQSGQLETTYPTDENGEPAFLQMQPQQTVQLLTDTFAEDAPNFVRDRLTAAQKAAEKATKKSPKAFGFTERAKEISQIKQERENTAREVEYWQNVSSLISTEVEPQPEQKAEVKPQPKAKTEPSFTEQAEEEVRKNQERLASMSEEEIAAAQAKVQENIEKGVYDKKPASRKRIRYVEQDNALGEASTPMEFVLREIATGRITFQWGDKGTTQGLGSHLGLSDSVADRQKLIWALSNEGYAPEVAAEMIHADMPAFMKGLVTDQDIFNMILDAFQYGSPSRMFEAAKQLNGNDIESQRGYEEDLERQAAEWEAEQNKMSVEDWTALVDIIEEELEYQFRTLTDEDINTIFEDIYNEEYGTGRNETESAEGTQPARDSERSNEVLPENEVDNETADGRSEVGTSETTPSDEQGGSVLPEQTNRYTVEKRHHEKSNKDIFAVNFTERMERDMFLRTKQIAKEQGGYYSSFGKGGFIFDTEDQARVFAERVNSALLGAQIDNAIAAAEAEVNTNPTEAQKEAGNYKMGHVTVDGMNITIENPKGSVRRGKDENGKEWESTMHYTYGYIRGTRGVDGDHIDIFLSDSPESGNVYVVDQINQKTGEFDESKVMYGFNSMEEAREAYLSNYEKGWKVGTITEVSKEEFKEWIDSSWNKIKPFSEYKNVEAISQEPSEVEEQQPTEVNGYRKGDKVYYKNEPATIFDFEPDGRPVLDTGMAPIMYEVGNWKDITPDREPITKNLGKDLVNKAEDKTLRISGLNGTENTVQLLINGEGRNVSVMEAVNMLRDEEWIEQKTEQDTNNVQGNNIEEAIKIARKVSRKFDENIQSSYRHRMDDFHNKRKKLSRLSIAELEEILQATNKSINATANNIMKYGEELIGNDASFLEIDLGIKRAIEERLKELNEAQPKQPTGKKSPIEQAKESVQNEIDKNQKELDDIKSGKQTDTVYSNGSHHSDLLSSEIREQNGKKKKLDTLQELKPGVAYQSNGGEIITIKSEKDGIYNYQLTIEGYTVDLIATTEQMAYTVGIYDIKPTKIAVAKAPETKAEDKPAYGSQNKVVSTERYEELRKKMRAKLDKAKGNNLEIDDFFNDNTPASQLKHVEGISKNKEYGISKVKELFFKYNTDKQQKALAEKVFSLAEKIGFKVTFMHTDLGFNIGGRADGDKIQYSHIITLEKNKERLPDVLLHEVIHGCTVYAIDAYKNGELKDAKLQEAVESILDVYDKISNEKSLSGEYGIKNEKEMIAEIANPKFRDKLKSINLWDKLKQAIKKLFFFEDEKNVTAYKVLDDALNKLLDNFNMDLFNTYEREKEFNEADWNFIELNNTKKYDPELVALGAEMAAYHVEAGAHKFVDFAKRMLVDMGEDIRPYLKLFYNSVRDFPGMESYEAEMTPYNEVKATDINNIKLTEDEQTETNTEAIVSEAEAIAGKAQTATAAETEQRLNDIEQALEKVNNQLALLGYYEADTTTPFHEVFGYAKSAEKKAFADAKAFAKKLQKDLGVKNEKFSYKNRKIASANIAPAGGDITVNIPLQQDKVLAIYIPIDIERGTDNMYISGGIMYRIESGDNFAGGTNMYINEKSDYPTMIKAFRRLAKQYIPEQKADTPVTTPIRRKEVKSTDTLSVDNLFTNENDVSLQSKTIEQTENDQKRRSKTENLEVGTKTQQEDARPVGERVDTGSRGSVGTDKFGSGRTSGLSPVQSSGSTGGKRNERNNRNERGIDYAPKSPKARFDANVRAIKLMRQLVASEEVPSREQMEVLRKFSGWGGLGTFFNNEDSAEYKKLRDILSDEEFDAAANSINSAYYTPANIIDSLWDIAGKLGFKGGNILEGSAGIGNIIGSMPVSIAENSNIEAVEIDPVTGNILKLLYPDAKVNIQGFEDTRVRNGSVDLAITNVPFVTGLQVHDPIDKDLSRKFRNIHDFCIAKNVRKLREGGIGIFITSSGTMDKSTALREWLVNEGNADFIGAFRLNNKTFEGASVTSDIIIIRKREGKAVSPAAIDAVNSSIVRTGEYPTGETIYDKKSRTWVPETKKATMELNNYFQQHPENMAGEMAFSYEKGETRFPGSSALFPAKGKNQDTMLTEWANSFQPIMEKNYQPQQVEEIETEEKNGALFVDEKGNFYVSEMGVGVPVNINANKVRGYEKTECLRDYNTLKSAIDEVLQYQVNNQDDKGLEPLLKKLNEAYDTFTSKYGSLNKNTSISFLRNDVDFPSIAAVEEYKEYKNAKEEKVVDIKKTNVFSGRVIGFQSEPQPKTVKDGVIASIYKFGHIDLDYIAEKLGKTSDEVKQTILNEGIGFVNPETGAVEVRYEYLSGNVRRKLQQAKENNQDGEFTENIKELEKVMPLDIPAHLIDFSLGSSWIDPQLYAEYIKEKFGVSDVSIHHLEGLWNLKVSGERNEKNRSEGVFSELFNEVIYGTELVDAALNNKTIQVKKVKTNYDKTKETIVDKVATQSCLTRIQEIKEDFKEWMHNKMLQDEELATKVAKVYNEKFNNIVPKQIDEMFLPQHFGGSSESVNLYLHQKRAVIRGTTEPLLLAHEVGSGKTFTLISTAMEMRRLGTAKKPMIVVQNATVGQFIADAKKLYPNARVLTITEGDRTPEGRRAFYGRIKYSDWDMIIVPQSTFDMIPDSPERQLTFIQEKIDEKQHALEVMQEIEGDENQIRQLENELADLQSEYVQTADKVKEEKQPKKRDRKREEKSKQNITARIKEQLDRKVDEVQYFDEMGIDAILVDEAHEYKRLGFSTAMTRGVKGIDPAGSKKAAGVYLKTRAVLEQNGWKNVIFATGTPISNTAAEIWTFMRYLMPKDILKDNEIYYFDDFVRNFGAISQSLEFSTSGKFKENTRFAAYINKPELIRLWSSVSDTVLTKDIDYVNDKIPRLEKDSHQDIFLPQSDSLVSIMNSVRAELQRFEEMTGKEKRENSHIPLTMYGIAKRAAIDTRLVDANAPDDPLSKTNKAAEETLRSLEETKDYKGTVAIFCDNQRRWDGKKVGFDLFEDLRDKLIAKGVPANQIFIMKPGMSVAKKQKVFDEVNAGTVRVIIGNTQTLGTGVNIQERLHTLIHMDAPDRPMDYTQRNGRILRQGNLHKVWDKPVRILRFGVEDSLDVTSYQRLKTKAGFIDSIMDGKAALANNQENRTLEEEEEGLFDNPVAILSGSQYALLKNQAEREYRKFLNKKNRYETDQIYVTNKLAKNKQQIEVVKEHIEDNRKKLAKAKELFPDGSVKVVTIEGHKCKNQQEIEDTLKEYVNKKVRALEDVARKDSYFRTQSLAYKLKFDGTDVTVKVSLTREENYDYKLKATRITVRRGVTYDIPAMGIKDSTAPGGYVKNAIDDITKNVVTGKAFSDAIDILSTSVTSMQEENSLLNERKGKPFEFGEELESAKQKVDEYSELMKAELAEKEEKYAGRGQESNIDLSEIASEEEQEDNTPEEEVRFRIDDDADEIRFRDVTDLDELEWLNSQPTVKAYRAMQVIDGQLYPPMMAAVKGKLVQPRELGTWEVADERPDIIKFTKVNKSGEEIGYVDLDKGTKDATGKKATITKDVAYNPYWHTSRSPLNDQFKSAWIRPNLVTVEVEVPESELTSGYRAQYSKNPVGEAEWKSGSVSSKLAKVGKPRKVILSRWDKPVRIVPESEVAQRIKELIGDADISIPENVVTPKLKKELEKIGVKISEPEKGVNKTAQVEEALKAGLTVDNNLYNTRFRTDELSDSRFETIEAIHEEAAKLNVPVTVYTSIDQIPQGAAHRALEKGLRVKGWYQNGHINVYLPNAAGMEDIKATLLHEGVAHYGLRNMVGEQNFNSFLDTIYAQASKEVRKEIVKLLPKYNYNMREATEEYLATMAEKGINNPTLWEKIKQLFRTMLEKVGYNWEITDNDLRYLLWESRNNLAKSNNPLDVAKETMMRNKLGIGIFGTQPSEETRFRFEDRSPLVQAYDAEIASKSFRFQEAFQDSMLSLKVLQDLIEKQSGKPMRTFENAYTAENRLSSINKVDNERYLADYFEPLVKHIDHLAKMSDRESVENYIYAKSGLERNEVFLQREAEKNLKEKTAELDERLASNVITQKQYDKELAALEAEHDAFLAEGKDYSGLTGLLLKSHEDELNMIGDEAAQGKREEEIKKEYKQHAEMVVSDFEGTIPAAEVDKLWSLIKAANNENLRKQFDSGMISAERQEELKNMMQYYVPLRGWEESIAEDFYDYTRKEAPVQKEKSAKGRKSLADNPIANIALSAQNAIILGNRNKMKQRFFNFVINRPNELVTIRDQWYAKTMHTVHEQVEAVYPDIEETDDAATIQKKLEEFENEMQAQQELGLAFRRYTPLGVKVKVKPMQKPEHTISVMINGQEYVMYVNGNPRAAQAINGKTNPEGEENIFWEYYNKAKRYYGGGLTSNNPDFVAANFVRDTIHSATMQFMNNGFTSSARFMLNTPKSFKAVFRGVMGKYQPGNKTDQYFQEFVQYGGETGYTAIHTIEDYKREYDKALNEVKGIKVALRTGQKGLESVITALEVANRIAEDINRFNAYMTSREAGKTIEESIDDAKNITVNFNKKGSLGKGKGAWAAAAWFMNKWILFFNPAVQGLYQVGQSAKNNKKRVLRTLASIAASGLIMPYINSLLISAFGGDGDDDYFNQTDYTRMNNWLIYTGNGYVKIPLPPFFREVYGMGDIFHRLMTGRMTAERASIATLRQLQSAIGFITLIPEGEPNIREAVSGIMPDLIAPLMDVAFNRDFTGRDIAKDTEWTKNLPEYERIYKGVSPVYVEFSRILNQLGGDDARRSPYFGTFINPAYMEHLVTAYTGGIGKTISNLTGAAVDIATGEVDNIEFRSIPVVNRFGSPITERSAAAAVNRVFYDYLDRYQAMKVAEKRYKQFIKDGRTEYRKELEQMKQIGEIELIRYFDGKMKVLRWKQNALKENPDNKELEKQIIDLKSEMSIKAKQILQ